MGNQRETIIPSRLNYIALISHKTNNTKLKLIIGFNTFVCDNIIDYLCDLPPQKLVQLLG